MTKRQFSPLYLDILCLNASLFAMVPLCRSLCRLCTAEAEFMVPEMCPSAYRERNFHPLQTCFQNPDCIEVMRLTSGDWYVVDKWALSVTSFKIISEKAYGLISSR